jgi:hypothetical protein
MLVLGIACERKAEPEPTPQTAPPPSSDLVAGTPQGDVEEWIADVRAGMDAVLSGDPAAVHRRVLDLYVSRQEYIEMYYGPGGRMSPPQGLADAVKLAETRFHEVMRLTGSTPTAAKQELTKAVNELKAQYDTVLAHAKTAPKRLRAGARSAQ